MLKTIIQDKPVDLKHKAGDVQLDIPITFLRYLQSRSDEKVLEALLVYDGVDRFDTIIEPDGLRTDPSTVTIDYNHRQVHTGAYLTKIRTVYNHEVEGVDGKKQVVKRALIGELHVPRTAQMYFFDKEGHKKSNGNLYEAIEKGEIRSVSVEFRPVKQSTNRATGITTYVTWDLLRLSLLDVTPGQPFSAIKVLRFLEPQDTPKSKSYNEITITKLFLRMSNTLTIRVEHSELAEKLQTLFATEMFTALTTEQKDALTDAIQTSIVAKEAVAEKVAEVAEIESERKEETLDEEDGEIKEKKRLEETVRAVIREEIAALKPQTETDEEAAETRQLEEALKKSQNKNSDNSTSQISTEEKVKTDNVITRATKAPSKLVQLSPEEKIISELYKQFPNNYK